MYSVGYYSICYVIKKKRSLQFCECFYLHSQGNIQFLGLFILLQDASRYKYNQSLFERYYRFFRLNADTDTFPETPVYMLKTQYRMHSDICRFPSRMFYGGQVKTYRYIFFCVYDNTSHLKKVTFWGEPRQHLLLKWWSIWTNFHPNWVIRFSHSSNGWQ